MQNYYKPQGILLIPPNEDDEGVTSSSFEKEKSSRSKLLPFYIVGDTTFEEKIRKYKDFEGETKREESKYKIIRKNLVEDGKNDEYVKRGSEINQYLRERKKSSRPRDEAFEDAIRRIKGKFKKLSDYIERVDYIVVCRRTTQPFDEEYAQGFISTSNVSLPFGKFLQVIIIPKDADVKIVDLADFKGEEEIYEIYLKPEADLVEVGGMTSNAQKNVFVVDTDFFRKNISFFREVAKRVSKNPLFCS